MKNSIKFLLFSVQKPDFLNANQQTLAKKTLHHFLNIKLPIIIVNI